MFGHMVTAVGASLTTSTASAAVGTLLCPTTVHARPGTQERLYAMPDWFDRIYAGPATPPAVTGMIAGRRRTRLRWS